MHDQNRPILMWFRRDLRLADHPALTAACATGRPVIPVYICDDAVTGLGAAPRWRLEQGIAALADSLAGQGSALILRRGEAAQVLADLITETGADAVYWSRLYDPGARARDGAIKSALRARGIEARSFGGHLMFEPWSVETKTGGYYKVFTPMWRAVRGRDVETPVPAPARIRAPAQFPLSDTLSDWALGAGMRRGAGIVGAYVRPGEAAAQDRLATFLDGPMRDYPVNRDLPGEAGTSGLSEYLSLGEISPHTCWHAAMARAAQGNPGAESWMRQLVWREFAYHLMYHTPHLLADNWKPGWEAFPWNRDPDHPHAQAWQRGRTGVRFVDAAMREMYVTGRMHNRGRMIVGSYLTKHLMCDWRIGMAWFDDCLVDWDPACNAMGWQWVAGSGPDAAPYFRVFNPDTQLQKFDPLHGYSRAWIAEGQGTPPATARAYFDAIPRAWAMSPDQPYPAAVVSLENGRQAALNAYQNRDKPAV